MYIIDRNFFFCPKKSKISPLGPQTFSKMLTTPSSRILEGLILSDGGIVSYNELYQLGWGENHVNIRPNTLYQHLSALRRAFDDCGIDGKKIVTHQRKGVSLTANIIREKDHIGNNSFLDQHKHSPPINFRYTIFLCAITQIIAVEICWDTSL